MVLIEGISGEAAGETVIPKGDEGAEAPAEGQVETPPAQQAGTVDPGIPPAGNEIKAELVKRYGEGKSDQEYLQAVWDSYRNGEKVFGQANEKVKAFEELVNQFGGVDALKTVLNTPAEIKPAAAIKLPDKIQGLIDSGHLDPNDPRDALIIDQEIRLEQANQAVGQSTHKEAVQTFEAGLKGIAEKYEFADLDVIRELGYKGAFAKMNDQQMWQAIDTFASKQHSKVTGLVDIKTQAKLDELKNLNKKKSLEGQPGGGKLINQTARQAFDAEHAKHFNE